MTRAAPRWKPRTAALIYAYVGETPKVFDCPSENMAVYSDGLSQYDIAYGGITPGPGDDLQHLYGIIHPFERYNQSGIGIASAHWIWAHDPGGDLKKSYMPFGRQKESGYFEGLWKSTQVQMPSRLIWFGDGGSGNLNLWEDDAFWIKRVIEPYLDAGFNRIQQDDYGCRRHRNKANYCFADGHTETLEANDIPCNVSECWWSVKLNAHRYAPP